MNLESWKRWQWAVLGAVAGALIGWADVSRQENERVGARGLSRRLFLSRNFSLRQSREGRG